MKVYPCSTETKPAAVEEFGLSWEYVRTEEGIYQCGAMQHARLVTVKEPGGSLTTLYVGDGKLEPAATHWKYQTFRRTTERLCLEVRP